MTPHQLEQLSGSSGCIICDTTKTNPRSLNLTIFWDAIEQYTCIPCLPDSSWCGYTGIVHGGVVGAILDESMAWAVKKVSGEWAFTANLCIRYKAPLYAGEQYEAKGRVVSIGKKITASSSFIHVKDKKIVATAEATFLPQR